MSGNPADSSPLSRKAGEGSGEGAQTRPTTRRLDLIVVLLLVLLAAVPRTANLLGQDPFVDETNWVDYALRDLTLLSPRTLFRSLKDIGRPPLFFWLIPPFALVVDNGFLASRLAAATMGVLSTVVLYWLGREIASRRVGMVAAILWALTPFSVEFARIGSDDTLLALLAMLSTWLSARLARHPTWRLGALCGLALGLGALAKTTGVFFAAAPPLALLLLGSLRQWRAYVWPLGVLVLVGLLAVIPLLIYFPQVVAQLAYHTEVAGSGTGRNLLADNLDLVWSWMLLYYGAVYLGLAGLGIVLAMVLRQRGLLLVTLLGALWLLLILAQSRSLFSRYLLFGLFPSYLLVAYTLDRAATFASKLARLVPNLRERPAWAAGLVVVLLGLGVALGPRSGLLAEIVLDPKHAGIPGSEHYRYVEQWYAMYGLGQVAADLRARAQDGPLTVLVPPATHEDRVLVPHAALRYSLRNAPNVRFVEVPALWRAQDLRDIRRLARNGPTYLLVNGSYTDAPGTPNDVPAFTRRLERELSADVPEAREVLRIPRPSAPNWLALYRLDGGS